MVKAGGGGRWRCNRHWRWWKDVVKDEISHLNVSGEGNTGRQVICTIR